jgi:hypothetical protein
LLGSAQQYGSLISTVLLSSLNGLLVQYTKGESASSAGEIEGFSIKREELGEARIGQRMNWYQSLFRIQISKQTMMVREIPESGTVYWIHLNDSYFCIFSFSNCKYQKHAYLILYRIDATPESNERLGRLVNHCQRNGNLTPRSHVLDGQPRVIFIDAKLMKPGEQLCYDYGDYSKSSIREHEWVLSSMLEQNG